MKMFKSGCLNLKHSLKHARSLSFKSLTFIERLLIFFWSAGILGVVFGPYEKQ